MGKTNKKIKLHKKKASDKNANIKWIVMIIIWTFTISASISFVSNSLLSGVGIFFAFFVLISIILIGIIFDIIGVAVTAAEEAPFHSLASRKVTGAKTAVKLIRNADKVSNFCNDVIGDICGVVSGAAGAIIISKLISKGISNNQTILALIVSATIASLTVGGKAIGKNFAMTQSNNIVYKTAWIIETIRLNRK
jgi:CBS domain containing-hemolysin-like protein